MMSKHVNHLEDMRFVMRWLGALLIMAAALMGTFTVLNFTGGNQVAGLVTGAASLTLFWGFIGTVIREERYRLAAKEAKR